MKSRFLSFELPLPRELGVRAYANYLFFYLTVGSKQKKNLPALLALTEVKQNVQSAGSLLSQKIPPRE